MIHKSRWPSSPPTFRSKTPLPLSRRRFRRIPRTVANTKERQSENSAPHALNTREQPPTQTHQHRVSRTANNICSLNLQPVDTFHLRKPTTPRPHPSERKQPMRQTPAPDAHWTWEPISPPSSRLEREMRAPTVYENVLRNQEGRAVLSEVDFRSPGPYGKFIRCLRCLNAKSRPILLHLGLGGP